MRISSFIVRLADRFSRATAEGVHAELDFPLGHGLAKNEALTDVVIATEEIGGQIAAEVAVGAAVIDIETAGCILGKVVASGFGLAFVPRRALALYRRKESIATLPFPEQFERDVVAVTRQHRTLPGHVERFVENILF